MSRSLKKGPFADASLLKKVDAMNAAGSKQVLELHGSIHRNYCERCHAFYDGAYVKQSHGIPRCEKCGSLIKPDVVLYEESLDVQVMQKSVEMISSADMLMIGGTSLVVYPAAGFVDYFHGKYLVVLNKDATPRDAQADLCIKEPIGKVLDQIVLR